MLDAEGLLCFSNRLNFVFECWGFYCDVLVLVSLDANLAPLWNDRL